MSKPHYVSSENRILLIVIAAISFSFLLVAYVIHINYNNALNAYYDRFANMMTQVVSVGGSERLQSADGNFHIRAFTDRMVQASPDIAGIEFYDADGRLIYRRFKSLLERELKNATDYAAPLKKIPYDGAAPQLIGSVHVKVTGGALQDIKGATQGIILWMFLSAWFLSVFAVSLNTYILNKHLRTFVRGVQRLSTGEFGYKILENDFWGELVTLAESFNAMSVRLRVYEDQNLETITFERNKLKAILLSIADGVVVCDMQGKVIIINDAACAMLGFKSADWAIDTDLKDYVTEENQRCLEPIITDFEQQRRESPARLPQLLTHTLTLPNQTFKAMLSPIQDENNHLLGYVVILHDVTREAEVDRMKTRFISNVSHELRTPVTTIKSYVDTIYNHGKDLDPDTYSEFIETINAETDRLKKLVNDILDFSRLEEGSVSLDREWTDITPAINLTAQSVKVLADQKKIHLSTAIESALPNVLINPDSIERVLRNLLSNAIKYTAEGGRIKVRAEVAEGGDMLEVSVQDTGCGIAEEHLPFIFDRFYRVENKVHTVKGTGLGLHLVKIAIEKHHGGSVFVKSEVGVGSTFGFRIPLSGV